MIRALLPGHCAETLVPALQAFVTKQTSNKTDGKAVWKCLIELTVLSKKVIFALLLVLYNVEHIFAADTVMIGALMMAEDSCVSPRDTRRINYAGPYSTVIYVYVLKKVFIKTNAREFLHCSYPINKN